MASSNVHNNWPFLLIIFMPFLVGTDQQQLVEKCRSNVCFNDGECFVSRGAGKETKFYCECRTGFAGLLCELSCDLRCQHGGKCQKTAERGEFCECPENFRGPLCAEKVVASGGVGAVPSSADDCRHSARGCPFAHVCLRDPGSGLFHCERNLCLRWGQSPCANNATCRPIKNDFICECPAGFYGRECADDVDECQEANVGPNAEFVDGTVVDGAENSVVVRGPCLNGGKCVNLPGTFACQCPHGYKGPVCQHHFGACANGPCGEHGQCEDVDNNGAYKCHCHGNFTGAHCDTKCQPPRMVTNATTTTTTTTTAGGGLHATTVRECVCPPGKTGDHCELDVVVTGPCSGEDGGVGKVQQCQNGGQCVPAGTKAFCICPTGFSGPACEHHDHLLLISTATTIASQSASSAAADGDQQQQQQSAAPAAVDEQNGTTKTEPVSANHHNHDHCVPNPCLNGGQCMAQENGPFCECPMGKFAGTRCQLKCHCLSDEICAESALERGQVECHRQQKSTDEHDYEPDGEEKEGVAGEGDDKGSAPAATTTALPYITSSAPHTQQQEGHGDAKEEGEEEQVDNGTTGGLVDAAAVAARFSSSSSNDPFVPIPKISSPVDDGGGRSELGDTSTTANNGTETTTPVSNCTQCANGAKCVRIGTNQFRCLCDADFAGALCDIKKPLCASLKCHRPGELCQPIRGQPDRKDEARCACPAGMGGKRCSRPNTMGFTNNGSVVLLQSARNKPYSLSFGIRTTLQTAHLASGENVFGQNEYTMLLQDGVVHLRIGGSANANETGRQFISGTTTNNNNNNNNSSSSTSSSWTMPVPISDDDWYQLKLRSSRTNGTALELWHPETGYLLIRHKLSLEHKLAQVLTTRLGHPRGGANTAPPFVGCMRAVTLNGAEPVGSNDQTRAINVQPGCHRQLQCASSPRDPFGPPCANGGLCVDLWDHFVCRCPRPFLAPRCAAQPLEATFGHADQPSNCVYALSTDDKQMVAEKTHITFLLRTADHRHQLGTTTPLAATTMPLFYIGEMLAPGSSSSSDGTEPDTGTFIAAQLHKGVPQVNARLGGKQVHFIDGHERVDDGKVHLVVLNREGNEIMLSIDDGKWHSVRIARSFAHPLLADQLIVGTALPPTSLPIGAFTLINDSSAVVDQFFKGTLQDFRVNDRLVSFFTSDADDNDRRHTQQHQHQQQAVQALVSHFGHKLSDQNLLKGTVSDDVCATTAAQQPCGRHGTCMNTFNNFECKCADGWMGRRCEQRDFCGPTTTNVSTTSTTNVCPPGTECQNFNGAFVCTSTASLFTSSFLRYTIHHQFNVKRTTGTPQTSHIGTTANDVTFVIELRTRTRNGHLLKLQSSNHSLILQLKNGTLQLALNGPENVAAALVTIASSTTPTITDGQWHQLELRPNANARGNAIALRIDGTGVHLNKVINFSLPNFIGDKLARISVGRVPEQDGFKGCVRNVHIASLPPLIFYPLTKVPKMADAMATVRLAHFVLQRHENVVQNGCQSANVCAKIPCLNGGTCEDLWNAMRCQCAPGFEGEHCEVNRDECDAQDGHAICAPNGKCVDGPNGFRCACATGFSGPKCTHAEELCRAGTCKNGAKCHTTNGTTVCECGPKLIGAWCQLDASTKCSEEPCQNGGQCFQSEYGQVGCWCKHGFTGPLCELRVDPCRNQPCANGGKCVLTSLAALNNNNNMMPSQAPPKTTTTITPASLFHCECPREFEGTLCERLADACGGGGDGGTSSRDVRCTGQGKCENIWGGHRCICDIGWRGRDCSVPVDVCAEEWPCVNGGTCTVAVPPQQQQQQQQQLNDTASGVGGGFRCQCPPFYEGTRCELAGVCADNPCQNGAECVQLVADAAHDGGGYVCRCKRNFRGKRCEQRVDVCSELEPCQNGGTCFVPHLLTAANGSATGHQKNVAADGDSAATDEDYRCACIPGFSGKKCEVDIDECAAKPCLHGGRCVDRVNGFQCYCNGTGYTGIRCERDIDECGADKAAATVGDRAHFCLNGGVCTNVDGDYQCECKTGYIGKRCHMANPCEPDPLTNRTRHSCAHGRCVWPRVRQPDSDGGEEYVQHECECMEGFTGELCMHLVEPQHQLALSNFIGAGVVLLVLCICLTALLYSFVLCARRKRAFEGTYSPSNQELAAQARLFSHRQQQNRKCLRPPLHRDQLSAANGGGGHTEFMHRTRRKKF